LAVPAAAYAVLVDVDEPRGPDRRRELPRHRRHAPCTVVSRTTAEQVQVGSHLGAVQGHGPPGRIVGWEITLSSPTAAQIHYFDTHEGGTSEAALAVIRQVRGLDYRLQHVSPLVSLQPYFGQTATFPLASSIRVTPGDVIALTVPTWVPALELQAGRKTAWRASRGAKGCSDVTDPDRADDASGASLSTTCIYRTALIDFGAIEISTP
jgi:hypothetical protein